MSGIGWTFQDNDWCRLRQIIQQIASFKFGYDASPTFNGLNLTGGLTVTGGASITGTLTLPSYSNIGALITNGSGLVSSLASAGLTPNRFLRSTATTGVLGWEQVDYADISGTPSFLTGYVPYTGATTEVNLGTHSLQADGGFLSTGITTTFTIPSGAGTRMFWDPSRHAFRAGSVTGTQWDGISIGDSTFAFGTDNVALGTYSGGTGLGNRTNVYCVVTFGQYCSILGGSAGSWVATDPLIICGDGDTTSLDASRHNSLVIYKNGTIKMRCASPSVYHGSLVMPNLAADATYTFPITGTGELVTTTFLSNYLLLTGGTMLGTLNMGNQILSNALSIAGTTITGSALAGTGATALTLGTNLFGIAPNTPGYIKLWSAGTNNYYTTITAGTQSASADYILPTSSVTGLLKNTAGTLSWDTTAYYKSGDSPSFVTATLSSQLKILESGATPTKYSIFQGGDQSVDITYTLPPTVGAAGTVLTDVAGNGTLSWASVPAGYTDAMARAAISETITGVDYNNTTGVFSLTSGYVIPTTTEEANWNTAYGWGNPSGVYLPLAGGTLTGSLLFSADATYDIGLNATTTRPRDLFLSRNAIVGGYVNASAYYYIGGSLFMANVGTNNLQLGITAMAYDAASVNECTAIGTDAGRYITGTAQNNVCVGYQAGRGKTTSTYFSGDDNLAIGTQSLLNVTTGYSNVCLGTFAGLNLTTGNANMCIGKQALQTATTGTNNVAVGTLALQASNNSNNVAIGSSALYYELEGYDVAIGYQAGYGKSTINHYSSVYIGYQAGYGTASSNYSMSKSVFIGQEVGKVCTSGGGNSVLIGYQSGIALTTGNRNIFLGYLSGSKQTTCGASTGDLLIIDRGKADGTARASAAEEATNSILYGVMADAPANQTLAINAVASTPYKFTANDLSLSKTITTVGTTGDQTINKACGRVNIAAAGTTVTVTNSLVTANSIIMATIATNDVTARVANVVAAAGSFVINIVACTAEVAINFLVVN